ncbi:MAG: hypothetical protein KTR28_08770 [Micavibrio sp.]|nr:hypothetical protein [Micavibrio sp.]
MDTIIKPTNENILALSDPEMRLDTGMKVQEALKRAEHWWNKTGSKEAQIQLKRQKKSVGGLDNGAGVSFASSNQDDPNFLPSGIIHGKHWDELTKREKLMITKSWHHFHVRLPDKIGENENIQFQMKDRESVQ